MYHSPTPQCAAAVVFLLIDLKKCNKIKLLTWDTPSSWTVVYILNNCAVNGSTVLVLHEKKKILSRMKPHAWAQTYYSIYCVEHFIYIVIKKICKKNLHGKSTFEEFIIICNSMYHLINKSLELNSFFKFFLGKSWWNQNERSKIDWIWTKILPWSHHANTWKTNIIWVTM
jgi:hypothetical protein